MEIILSACVLYLAVFAFHQAESRRTVFTGIKSSRGKQRLVRAAGWGLALASLLGLSVIHGAERGIPIWLAAFIVAAFLCLLGGAILPKQQIALAGSALILGCLSAMLFLIGGVA